MQRKKQLILWISILFLCTFALNNRVNAASSLQDVLMTNMHIYVVLENDCSAQILIQTGVTNTGPSDLALLNMRVDVRSLQVMSASLNGSFANSSVVLENNYVIISIQPDAPIPSGASMQLNLNFTTQCLQEQIGLNSDGSMYVNHLIYYIRPLNEIQNLTFSAALPLHAILQTDAAAPLFPSATSNHTDGTRTIYVWKTGVLLPGQEIAYIIKYMLPTVLVDTVPVVMDNSLLIGMVASIGTAITVLVLERVPRWTKRLRTKEFIVSGKISIQEQEILNLLSSRGGSCSQREIYENLDMSQAMASMMLTSLEERGLIKRLRSGRENVVHIMES
jgi:uncharacterized membrane protein